MKTVFEHIEHVRGKPHHVRKRVAFASAAIGTIAIALVWFVGSLSFGTFAISSNSFADGTGHSSSVTTESTDVNAGLAGAAAALPPQSVNAPAHIEIIDTSPATPEKKPTEETTIPF